MKTLSDLPPGSRATVLSVADVGPADMIAARLRDLGFVAGEEVALITYGPFGAEPMLVQVGQSRFALRKSEASRVVVQTKEGADE